MKKMILFGISLSVFVLLSVSAVSAVESNTILESDGIDLSELFGSLNLNSVMNNLFNSSLSLIIGIILGGITAVLSTIATVYFIFQYMQKNKDMTPQISCVINQDERSLVVCSIESVDGENVSWADIQIDGCCDNSSLGVNVTAGDILKDCHGTINMTYIPTGKLMGTWEFD